MANFLFLAGSKSDDFGKEANKSNPLPPCPDSPNCILITKFYNASKDVISRAAKSVIEKMDPAEMKIIDDPFRIRAVFKIFTFKDDFVLLVENENDSSSRIHIRSSSRVGYSDLGVNRRRVKRFFKKLERNLN